MAKAPRYANRVAWARNAKVAGLNWLEMTSFLVAVLVAILVFALWLPAPIWIRAGAVGFFAGASIVFVGLMLSRFHDPQMRGNLAELWTAEAFRRVRGWHVINSVSFQYGDLDHMVVTPSGVLAVETKYHPRRDDDRRRKALETAKRSATRATAVLRTAKIKDLPTVTPVLMVWGKGAPALPDGYRKIDGVWLLDGDNPGLWGHKFNAPLLAVNRREELRAAVANFEQTRTEHDDHESLSKECWREFRQGVAEAKTGRAEQKAKRAALRRRHAANRA